MRLFLIASIYFTFAESQYVLSQEPIKLVK